MNKIFKHIFIGLLFLSLSWLPVYGQNQSSRSLPQPLCEKKGIKFPIDDLGGCKDYFSCRQFCNDPQNMGKCGQFAKARGITKADVLETEEFVRFQGKVSQSFGCSGRAGCKLVCDNPDNFAKCNQLAKESKIAGGFIDNPADIDIIRDAKQNLGCGTQEECKKFCDKKENQDKCTQFAGQVGLVGGQQQVGPGGCQSAQTCQDFCKSDNNQKECSSFGIIKAMPTQSAIKPTSNQQPGPGGCKSDAECNEFCSKNPTNAECQKYGEQHGFKGPGGCSTPDSCGAYCNANYTDTECAKYGSTAGFKGPGGCSDIASCTSFCQTNNSDPECQKYAGEGGFKGPGGCSDIASCTAYCTANLEDLECQKYAGQYGGGGMTGPGGCKDEASCESFCQSNPSDSQCLKQGGGQQDQQPQ